MKTITASNYWHLAGSNSENSTILRTRTVLKEPVNKDALVKAAEQTLKRYPAYAVRLVSGENGMEYRDNHAPAPVFPLFEEKQYHLGSEETNGYLFRISYGEKEIVLSQHHVITDGKGITEFLKTLLYYYLKETGVTVNPEGIVRLNEISYDAEAELEMTAEKYCDLSIPEKPASIPEGLVPFALPETYWDEAGNYSCRKYLLSCSASEVKEAASKTGSTVSAWLLALLEAAYGKTYEMGNTTTIAALTMNKRPAFHSDTMMNFSGYMILAVPPQLRALPFAVQAQQIEAQIKAGNTKENALLQTNTRIRECEEFRKLPVEAVFHQSAKKDMQKKGTRKALAIMLTNVGVLKFPKDILAHVESVDLSLPSFESTVDYAAITAGDCMTIGATMCFDHPELLENIRTAFEEQGVSCRMEDCGTVQFDIVTEDAVSVQ